MRQAPYLDTCTVGTDLRKLAMDGFPASNLLGCDLRRDFIEAGYRLFQDKETSPITFFTSDIFDLSTTQASEASTIPLREVKSLEDLKGRLTYIYTGALFHLFDEDMQYSLASRLALLLNLDQPAIIFGRHQGLLKAGLFDFPPTRFVLFVSLVHHQLLTLISVKDTDIHPIPGPSCGKRSSQSSRARIFATSRVSAQAYFSGTEHEYMFWSVNIASEVA